MSTIPAIKPKKLLQILQKRGFYIYHQKGSHIVLKNNFNPKIRVALPLPNGGLKRKTLLFNLKQASLDKKILFK